jgi:hypothetical protein
MVGRIKMGFTEILTLIFIVLKLTHQIDWSWWWVLSPELFVIVLYVVFAIVGASVFKLFRR